MILIRIYEIGNENDPGAEHHVGSFYPLAYLYFDIEPVILDNASLSVGCQGTVQKPFCYWRQKYHFSRTSIVKYMLETGYRIRQLLNKKVWLFRLPFFQRKLTIARIVHFGDRKSINLYVRPLISLTRRTKKKVIKK